MSKAGKTSGPAAQDSLSVCRKHGMLTKREGGMIKSWKRRLFVLVGNMLYYYKTPTDSAPVGIIEIGVNVCGKADEECGRKNAIFIKTPERTHYAFTSEPREVEEWLNVISDCVKDGTSEHVRLASLKGKALKKAKSKNEWNSRYFALHENTLYYFRDKFDLRPKGSIVTFKVQLQNVIAECHKNHSLKIMISTRTYYLSFDSAEECAFWGAALQKLDYTNQANSAKDCPEESVAPSSGSKLLSNEALMTGYMTKQGGVHKNWKRRFFVLSRTHLTYYKREGDSHPKGSVDLNGRVVTRADGEIEFKYAIRIDTPSRRWYMYADSEADAERWCQKLKEVTQKTTKDVVNDHQHDGWLTKRGGRIKTWKRRYCVVKGSQLQYFKSKLDAVPKGAVQIAGIYVEKLNAKDADEQTGKQHVIKMVTNTRIWYMYADNKEDLDTWTLVFKAAALQMTGETHIVDCTGAKGSFTKISDAIAHAEFTDKIVIQPGLYQETLVVDKPIIIEGAGDVVIESKFRPVITFQTSTAKIQNLKLKHLDKDDVNCVDIKGGNIVIEHCVISSGGGCGVNCTGSSALTLHNSQIIGCRQYGVQLQDKSTGIIEECDICDNDWDGVLSTHLASATLRKNRIHNNQYNGVCISCAGSVLLEHCDVYENEWDGVNVTNANPQMLATLYNNRVYRNKGNGICFTDHCEGKSVDNEIFANGTDSIRSNTIIGRQ